MSLYVNICPTFFLLTKQMIKLSQIFTCVRETYSLPCLCSQLCCKTHTVITAINEDNALGPSSSGSQMDSPHRSEVGTKREWRPRLGLMTIQHWLLSLYPTKKENTVTSSLKLTWVWAVNQNKCHVRLNVCRIKRIRQINLFPVLVWMCPIATAIACVFGLSTMTGYDYSRIIGMRASGSFPGLCTVNVTSML